MRVLGNVAKIAITWPFGHFWKRFCAKIFSSLCTISTCKLADNATFHRVLLGLSSEGYLLGDFRNISLGPPFALFQKMRVLGDLAKIAITWQFEYFWSRFFAPKSFSVFAL